MKAIVMRYNYLRFTYSKIFGIFSPKAYTSRLSSIKLMDIEKPELISDDWVRLKTIKAGICGSDTKEVFLDSHIDNPLRGFVTFPHVIGHEVVAEVEKIGSNVGNLKVGDIVTMDPWLPCKVRELEECPSCKNGKYQLCRNLDKGRFDSGMLISTCKDTYGCFAEYFLAHKSQCYALPKGVCGDDAVLSDPVCVSLHSILKNPPEKNTNCLVYGIGALGTTLIQLLKSLYPTVKVIAIGRTEFQRNIAVKMGADYVITSPPEKIMYDIAELLNQKLMPINKQNQWLTDGIDYIYDTVTNAETLNIGLKIVKQEGKIIILGASTPKKYDWTLHNFKEITMVGSNGISTDTYKGIKQHDINIYFDLIKNNKINFRDIITHRFKLQEYQKAFIMSKNKEKYNAIKIIFDF